MTDLSATASSIAPLFHHRPFRLLFTTRAAANTANQMQAVAVGWLIYDLTLVQFLPPLALSLIAGQVVDHHSRRLVLVCCYIVEFIVSAALLVLAGVSHGYETSNGPTGLFRISFEDAHEKKPAPSSGAGLLKLIGSVRPAESRRSASCLDR